MQNAPGSALIEKTKHDIWVVCVKLGYQQATYFNHSGAAGATVGNIILGGGIGWIIDSASGADNKYDSPVNLTLSPNPPGQAQGVHEPAVKLQRSAAATDACCGRRHSQDELAGRLPRAGG